MLKTRSCGDREKENLLERDDKKRTGRAIEESSVDRKTTKMSSWRPDIFFRKVHRDGDSEEEGLVSRQKKPSKMRTWWKRLWRRESQREEGLHQGRGGVEEVKLL